MSVAGNALVLAPSHEMVRTLAGHCNAAGWTILTTGDVAIGVGPLAVKSNALLALAGRYDGIDTVFKRVRKAEEILAQPIADERWAIETAVLLCDQLALARDDHA